jgi:sulfur-carrier protein adenylyltransferase/sulfurtransferase
VLSSVYQYEGQLQVVRGDRADRACLRCVWPAATRDGLVGNCAEAGVLGPVPGVFGSLQALEALKILLDLPGQIADELLVIDLLAHSVRRVRMRRATECVGGPCVRAPAVLAPAVAPDVELAFPSLEEALQAGFTIVDVRDAQEVAAEPTPAEPALHIPLGDLLHDSAHAADARRLLVCATGKRSLAAAQELRARGLSGVYSLHGGIRGLRRQAAAGET